MFAMLTNAGMLINELTQPAILLLSIDSHCVYDAVDTAMDE